MDLFESDEDRNERYARNATVAVIIVILIVIGGWSWLWWEAHKPLPQTETCKKLGFEAGVDEGSRMMCYKDCTGNVIETCRTRRMIL